MSAAPEEYEVSLAQNVHPRRSRCVAQKVGLLKKQLTWKQFGAKLVKRFSAQGSYDLTEQFNSVKQNTSTVAEYNKLFEDLMAGVHEENPELNNFWFVGGFVNGLRVGIKYQIRPFKPQTLTDAYLLAREIEPCYPPPAAQPRKQYPPYNNYYQKTTLDART